MALTLTHSRTRHIFATSQNEFLSSDEMDKRAEKAPPKIIWTEFSHIMRYKTTSSSRFQSRWTFSVRAHTGVKIIQTAVLIVFFFSACAAMASEFDHPWNHPESAIVIDAYYANSIDWNLLATEPKVVGIIHKATIGSKKIDPGYHSRKMEAKERGYLWGSYHLGVAGNPEKQADYYINTVKPAANELIALDLEDLNSPRLMNANEAIRFIKQVKKRLGRYPVLYANHTSATIISEKFKNTVFAKTPLWYAKFAGSVNNFPTGPWSSYTLWQFSSEILTQKAIPGTKADMDVNVFNGSKDDLKAKWPLTRSAPRKAHS